MSLTVAYSRNRDGIPAKFHTCNVCGKESDQKEWYMRYILIGEGHSGREEEFLACSEKCRDQDMKNNKDKKQKKNARI